jgi:hypothetical protein
VTLRTADGFSACFSIQRQQQNQFGAALLAEPSGDRLGISPVPRFS